MNQNQRKWTMSKESLVSLRKKDFDIQWFKGSGGGGQHRNKHANCCRIVHPDSGAKGECSDHKSREQNQRVAFSRLLENTKFKIWLNMKSMEAMNKKTIDETVDEMMDDTNIKVEVRDENGKWVEESQMQEK